MSFLIAPDISHYQPALTTAYPRDFVIFKATQGTYYQDDNFLVNAGVCHSLYESGHLAGAVCYHVFSGESVQAQFDKIKAAVGSTPPTWLLGIMIDLESWTGTKYALSGDHSPSVNQLGALLAGWLGSWRRVWLYGNSYDLGYLAPHHDTRFPVVLAAYTSELRYTSIKGAVGQQYSDGETKYPVPTIATQPLPRFTPGLGNCDHNVFPAYPNGKALRTWMRPPKPTPKPTTLLERLMSGPTAQDKADFITLLKDPDVAAALHDAAFGAFNSADPQHPYPTGRRAPFVPLLEQTLRKFGLKETS